MIQPCAKPGCILKGVNQRQLSHIQKRLAIERAIYKSLAHDPRATTRKIAKPLGVDHKTVAKVWDEIASSGEIPHRNKNNALRLGDNVETPHRLCRYIHDIISPHHTINTILDPCSGRGNLTKPWAGARVISFELDHGKDFLTHTTKIECDLVLCNPPFSGEKPLIFWQRIREVAGDTTPLVFVVHAGFGFTCYKTSKRYKVLAAYVATHPVSICILPQNIFGVVAVPAMILLCNMPRLRPSYVVPGVYL